MDEKATLRAKIAALSQRIHEHKARLQHSQQHYDDSPSPAPLQHNKPWSATSTRFSKESIHRRVGYLPWVAALPETGGDSAHRSHKRPHYTLDACDDQDFSYRSRPSSKRQKILSVKEWLATRRLVPVTEGTENGHDSAGSSSEYRILGGNTENQQDDAVPTAALQCMASSLSPLSEPETSTTAILELMTSANILRGGRRTTQALPKSNVVQQHHFVQNSGFYSLPDELLLKVTDDLQPPDVICLGLTCKKFFLKVDFQLADLRHVENQRALFDAFRDYGLHDAIGLERALVTERLDRDTMNEIVEMELAALTRRDGKGDARKYHWTCSICRTLHPGAYFSAEELQTAPFSRKCLAATAKIRICDHWSEDYTSLRKLRPELKMGSTSEGTRDVLCSRHFAHTAGTNGNKTPTLQVHRESGASMERTIGLVRGTADHPFDTADVNAALQARRHLELCPHVKLNDPEVIGLYKRSPKSYLEICRGQCGVCRTSWHFERHCVSSGPLDGYRFPTTLAVVVYEHIDWSWKPWGEWLHHVEGGGRLVQLRDGNDGTVDG